MPLSLSSSPTAAATTAASGAAHRFLYPHRPCLHRAGKVSLSLLLCPFSRPALFRATKEIYHLCDAWSCALATEFRTSLVCSLSGFFRSSRSDQGHGRCGNAKGCISFYIGWYYLPFATLFRVLLAKRLNF